MSYIKRLKEKIAFLPDSPGVYLMKDKSGAVIYIGKAKSLRKRLGSYFSGGLSGKTAAMISNVYDIKYSFTPTESLALLLEASLIRRYKPKYNISLRDDKSFPMAKITNEIFPLVCLVRKRSADGARYFGPYTNSKLLKEALRIIRRHFPYRSCRHMPKKECMYYKIGLCPAPCVGKIGRRAYAKTIENISLALEGKADALIKRLSRQMSLKSDAHEFEEAAKLRDQIAALSSISRTQAGFLDRSGLEGLRSVLGLSLLPERIEAFDISNIYGKEATGSMVSFLRGFPDKDNYRRFRIKTVGAIDDYGMLSEVLKRRYSRLIRESSPLPGLILIDGGRGHLLTAQKVLSGLGLHIPLVSIAKEQENIYTKGKPGPLKLSPDSPALNLIRRIRDEAHRFAVSYHHILRRKKTIGR